MNSKVSIIIPVYNAEKFIEKGIKSILEQTYKNIEIILINDGSADNSLKIIKKYEKKFPDIIKVYNQKNMGVGKTRNKGIEVSNGDYITFIDADDYIDSDFIETLMNKISDNDIIVSGYRQVDEMDKTNFIQRLKEDEWSKFRQVTIWANLYRKTFLVDNGLKFNDLKIGEDIVFSISSYTKSDKIISTSYIGYNNVCHFSSVTHDKKLKKDNDILSTIKILGTITSDKNFMLKNGNYIRNFYYKTFVFFLIDKARVLSLNELKKYYFDGFSWLKKYLTDNNIPFKFKYISSEPFKVNFAIFITIMAYKLKISNLFLKLLHKFFYN